MDGRPQAIHRAQADERWQRSRRDAIRLVRRYGRGGREVHPQAGSRRAQVSMPIVSVFWGGHNLQLDVLVGVAAIGR